MSIKRSYPDSSELLELAKNHQSIAGAAKALGIPRKTFQEHLDRVGILDEFKKFCIRKPKRPEIKSVKNPAKEVSKEDMLEQEVKELRRSLSNTHSESVREARVINAIQSAVGGKTPLYKPKKIIKNGDKAPHTLVLFWSDLHASEVVSAEETNGANAYNWEIMLARHDELRRGVLSFADRFGPIDELVIAGLGDMLSGSIHDELAETNEMNLSDAIVQLGLDGAEFVESFTDEFPVRFAGVTGNHGRFHHKPRAKGRFDNADWLCYHIMKQRLSKNKHINFEVPRPGRFPVDVLGRRILLMHGDGIRSTMVGVPWGGVIRMSNLLSNQYAAMGMPIDHFAMGHYHEPNAISNRKILMNGSVKGIDEYSLQAFGGGCKPVQLLAPFHPKWGLVGVHYIDLEPEFDAT